MEEEIEIIVEIRVKGTLEKAQDFADELSTISQQGGGTAAFGLELLTGIAVYRAELVNVEESEDKDDDESVPAGVEGGY